MMHHAKKTYKPVRTEKMFKVGMTPDLDAQTLGCAGHQKPAQRYINLAHNIRHHRPTSIHAHRHLCLTRRRHHPAAGKRLGSHMLAALRCFKQRPGALDLAL